MSPIQGLHYKLAGLYESRAILFNRANHPDTLPADAHAALEKVGKLDSEITLTLDLIAKGEVLVEWIENIANGIERERIVTAPRRQAIERLRTTADGIRRELGHLPPPKKS